MGGKRQVITREIHWVYSAINVEHKMTSLIMKLQKEQKKYGEDTWQVKVNCSECKIHFEY